MAEEEYRLSRELSEEECRIIETRISKKPALSIGGLCV
jgi:hypothetical protein